LKASIVQLDWTQGNEITLLENGTDFFPRLCEAIDTARHSVHLETYIFTLDRTGRRVLLSLLNASRRGIKVRVVVDGFGAADTALHLVSVLQQAGARVMVYRPEPKWFAKWIPSRQRLRRMHRKIAVIDGELGFVGGINIVDDYDDLTPEAGPSVPRFDYAVALRGPIVAHAAHIQKLLWLHLNWLRLGRHPSTWQRLELAHPPGFDALASHGEGPMSAALVLRDNLRYRRTFEQAYLYGIERAQTDIFIANAYFLPGRQFQQALIRAAERGVRVRVLVQGKVEYRMQYHATRALYDPLLAGGVEIYEYMPSYLHAKVAVIDGLATVGSSNIDPFSFLLAREANVVVDEIDFADRLKRSLERAVAEGGVQVRHDAYRRRGLWRRLIDGIAYRLVRIGVSVAGEPGED